MLCLLCLFAFAFCCILIVRLFALLCFLLFCFVTFCFCFCFCFDCLVPPVFFFFFFNFFGIYLAPTGYMNGKTYALVSSSLPASASSLALKASLASHLAALAALNASKQDWISSALPDSRAACKLALH